MTAHCSTMAQLENRTNMFALWLYEIYWI